MKPLPHLYPALEDWPIYHLSKDRRKFVKEIEEFTFEKFVNASPEDTRELLATTIYLERIRIKEEPWKVDPPNEKQFWNKIRKYLSTNSGEAKEDKSKELNDSLIQKIIHRYAEEIVGTFQVAQFRFARRALTFFFNRLLNTAADRTIKSLFRGKRQLHDSLKVSGPLDQIRGLFDKGTVVVVPTHFSNLDSIMVGYAMDQIVGLPSFSYGAGLNLYNTGWAAFFMNRLGAYRVDRRKKNNIYLETLKSMSTISMTRGVNTLFFPGGTRSRSGAIEKKLKMGLLSTVLESQQILCAARSEKKVFVVPLVISYHFVLEAAFLIEQHLKITGKEKYFQGKDASKSFRQWIKFAWDLFSQHSDIYLSFGKPMDVVGNFVDEEGNSFDRWNTKIDIKDYFISQGKVKKDKQRDSEYTRILSEKIVDRFHVENIVLSSHIVAFVGFEILQANNENLDLYSLLHLPDEDYSFPYGTFFEAVEKFREILLQFEKNDKLKLSDDVKGDISKLIKDGITFLGTFHINKPLRFNKEGDLVSDDFHVLHFYANRLSGYDLENQIRWGDFKINVVET
jgi:glycerol-3-phosphate O-acyltransferase